MKKLIIKLIASLVASAMLLLSVPVFADSSMAQDFCDELVFSMLSSEAADAVTKDLDLELNDLSNQYPDVIVNWYCDREDIIKIVGNTGKIMPPTENTSVTLTAVVFAGDDKATKDFSLTVMKRNTNVSINENFEGIEKDTSIELTKLNERGFSLETKDDTNFFSSVTEDPDDSDNSVLCINRISPRNDIHPKVVIPLESSQNDADIYKYKSRMKYVHGTSGSITMIMQGYTPANTLETAILVSIASNKITCSTRPAANTAHAASLAFSATTTSWFDLEIIFDLHESRYKVSFNGVPQGDWVYLPSDVKYTKLRRIELYPFRNATNTKIFLDDVSIMTERKDKLSAPMLVAHNADQIAVRSEYDTEHHLVQLIGNVLDESNRSADSLSFGKAGLISSDASNSFALEEVLSDMEFSSPAFRINGEILGAGRGARLGVKAQIQDYELNIRDIGKVYTDESGNEWTLINIIDKNNVVFLSENNGTAYQWDFADTIDESLTCGNDEISLLSQSPGAEILPSLKREDLCVSVVSDGEKTDVSEGETATGDSVEIVEEYTVLNPATIAEYLTENRPTSGYSMIPVVDGDALATVKLTYAMNAEGLTMISTAHSILVDTTEFNSFDYIAMSADDKYTNPSERAFSNFYRATEDDNSYTSVILPVLDAKRKEIANSYSMYVLHNKSSFPKNILPYFIPDEAFPAGKTDMSVNAISAWKYDCDEYDGIFEIDYLDEKYLFFDFSYSLNYSYVLPEDDREVIELVKSSDGVSYICEDGNLNVTAGTAGDYLIVKIGYSETDEEMARVFLEQNQSMLEIDLTDKEYTSAQQQVLTGFVTDVKDAPPASPEDIKSALMRAQAVPSFSGIKVSEADSLIKKYGKYLGVSEEQYSEDCEAYGSIEIGKAFSDKTFNIPKEIKDCYDNRIDELKEDIEEEKPAPSPGGSGGPSFKVEQETELPKPQEPVTPKPQESVGRFTDLPKEHWAAEYINKLAEMHIIEGYEDGSVRPEEYVSREQLVKMMISALDLQNNDVIIKFSDVADNRWSKEYIATAAGLGIITGYGNGNFAPTEKITREDMVVILKRSLEKAGIKMNNNAVTREFTDAELISDYAVASVAEMVSAGFINGMGDNSFAPKESVTRAQAAKIIYLVCEAK